MFYLIITVILIIIAFDFVRNLHWVPFMSKNYRSKSYWFNGRLLYGDSYKQKREQGVVILKGIIDDGEKFMVEMLSENLPKGTNVCVESHYKGIPFYEAIYIDDISFDDTADWENAYQRNREFMDKVKISLDEFTDSATTSYQEMLKFTCRCTPENMKLLYVRTDNGYRCIVDAPWMIKGSVSPFRKKLLQTDKRNRMDLFVALEKHYKVNKEK